MVKQGRHSGLKILFCQVLPAKNFASQKVNSDNSFAEHRAVAAARLDGQGQLGASIKMEVGVFSVLSTTRPSGEIGRHKGRTFKPSETRRSGSHQSRRTLPGWRIRANAEPNPKLQREGMKEQTAAGTTTAAKAIW